MVSPQTRRMGTADGVCDRGDRQVTMRQARPDLTAAALASLAAAAVALVLRVADPFAHGTWLIAYLVLVGFLAQLLLGLGQAALLSAGDTTPPTRRVRLAQALLWNVGVVAVPLGVLAETRLAVVAGSISLISALILLTKTARPALATAFAGRRWIGCGYASLLVAMAASTLIGTALAWDIPWT
jgi:hypothetical protein